MGVIPWAPSYQNGQDNAIALMTDYDGLGHFLQPAATASLKRFSDAFEAEFGKPITISEAFRNLSTQRYYYQLYIDGDGNMAAVPGTSSHGQGLAVDINSWVYRNSTGTAEHAWMRANAARFGWSWDLVGRPSGEPWHWNYIGSWTVVFTPDETPEQKLEKELMGAMEDIQKMIDASEKRLKAYIDDKIDKSTDLLNGHTYRSDPAQPYRNSEGKLVKGTGSMMFVPYGDTKGGMSFTDYGLFELLAKNGLVEDLVENRPINEYNAIALKNGLTTDPGQPA